MHTEGLNKASSRHRVEFSTLGPFLSKASVDQRTNSLFSIYLPTHHIHPIQGILGSASSREAIEHNACMCVCVCVCARARANSLQSCPTLCNPMDCSPQGSSVHGILEAKILECLPCSPSVDLSDPGIKPSSPALAGGFFTTNATREATEHRGQGQSRSQTPVLGWDLSSIPYKPRHFKILPNWNCPRFFHL